ncbi:unnamed protein product [Leptidea sinapis]|uniref:Uncharacterized protein n=1 Tax=Leptidea sinapis TaxID=189913 RepID=A0A5E4QPU9_9NEOP|nr:unnamed protein product [Leptidea sinapis]
MDNHIIYIKQEDTEQVIAGWTADGQLDMMPQVQSDCNVSVNQLCTKQLRVNLLKDISSII